jgi:small-conductance mechanosensitive channel
VSQLRDPRFRRRRPAPRRAPWLLALALTLAWAGPIHAQEKSAAPAEPPPKPSVEPIPTEVIGGASEQAKSALTEIQASLAPSEAIGKIESELKVDLAPRVQKQLEASELILSSEPNVSNLDQLTVDWTIILEHLATARRQIDARSKAVAEQLTRINERSAIWKATREAAEASDASRTVFAQIDEVHRVIDRVTADARKRQDALLKLQSAVAVESQKAKADLKKIEEARHGLVGDLLRKDAPAIWEANFYETLDGEELRERVEEHRARQNQTIRVFFERNRQRAIVHVAFTLLMILAMLVVRRRVRVRAGSDEGLAKVQAVFDGPISLSLLLSFFLARWWYHPIPSAVVPGMLVAMLIPAVLILRRLVGPPLYPVLYALVVFFFAERVRDFFAPLPGLPRVLFLVEMVALVGLTAWWLRPARLTRLPAETLAGPIFRVVGTGMRVAMVVGTTAFLAEAAGYRGVAMVLGRSLLVAGYATVILYGAVRVVDGLAAYALRARPLRLLVMVQHHRWTIRRRARRVLHWAAGLYWAWVVLGSLEIRGEVLGALAATLEARLPLPEVTVTFGDLLAFGITLWATFLISRFIRFALQEDVYTRVPFRKGRPYAISTLTHYTILLIGFLLAIVALGLDLNRFTLLAGAFGVGIGFGLQTIVNNFVSGIILLTERPVEVGDTVSLGEVFGEVQRIGIRSSTVRTWQGAEVIVPNADLISLQVTNWTLSDRRRRLEIPVGVAYGTDPRRVIDALVDVAKAESRVLEDPEPYVLFLGFGDSSLDFELRAWTVEFDFYQRVRSDLCVISTSSRCSTRAPTGAGRSRPPGRPRPRRARPA